MITIISTGFFPSCALSKNALFLHMGEELLAGEGKLGREPSAGITDRRPEVL